MRVFMFHYVKPSSKYYHINLSYFEKIIKYLVSNFKVISLEEYDHMLNNGINISDQYVMLTFDDGTFDHYKYVYPVMKKYGCSGLFFIPSCINNKKMLNIQIIHQLLAKVDINDLIEELKNQMDCYNLDINNYQYDKSLDKGDTALFKQLLQYMLPDNVRNRILYELSKKYNLSLKVEDNYINLIEMQEMKKNNMFFGLHTVSHPKLEFLRYDEQEYEIVSNMKFLLDNSLIEKNLISIAFPYGSYNKDTIDIMNKYNIKYGFKVNDDVCLIDLNSIILIDRIDCNKLKEEIYE